MADTDFGPLYLTVYGHIRPIIQGWLEKRELDTGDFYAGFINYCMKAVQGNDRRDTSRRSEEKAWVIERLRAYPLAYTPLVQAMEWYDDNVYQRRGASAGVIRVPGAEPPAIRRAEHELYERLFSQAEREAHNDPVMRTFRVASRQKRRRRGRRVRRAKRQELAGGKQQAEEADEEVGEESEEVEEEEADEAHQLELGDLRGALAEADRSREAWEGSLTMRPKEV